MYDIKEWQHVFKVDPNKENSDEFIEAICESGTDAIMVGGTDGVTLDQVLDLLVRIRRYSVPVILEVSNLESITPGYDLYFIPTVLNTTKTDWITGLHHAAVKEYGEIMNWEEILVQGYCILNPECKAAKVTEANTKLDTEDVVAYAQMAEKMFHLPIFYIEYSGTYGDPEVVKQVKTRTDDITVFYGGGVTSTEKATEMAAYADVVVVGNYLYDDLAGALKTVQAVKGK
ncbi:heptaprenylglyceryl phosphate synthase [Mangrovibacillus cuniculi]|uniref:Heptaprenylglyceryl phosphate synthase n=1 Tax=Mangrovibacillus cuniculi TaxID=2593652 RepID=A0A7S8C8X1_9BACI|nr:heptaprenylglyceryl phosphate synthase [Mangrovibacillus cuniculi]QPC45498.1 heptaprenylglyceryl phosphate synthase [Mangrovibacillus cuniculi]